MGVLSIIRLLGAISRTLGLLNINTKSLNQNNQSRNNLKTLSLSTLLLRHLKSDRSLINDDPSSPLLTNILMILTANLNSNRRRLVLIANDAINSRNLLLNILIRSLLNSSGLTLALGLRNSKTKNTRITADIKRNKASVDNNAITIINRTISMSNSANKAMTLMRSILMSNNIDAQAGDLISDKLSLILERKLDLNLNGNDNRTNIILKRQIATRANDGNSITTRLKRRNKALNILHTLAVLNYNPLEISKRAYLLSISAWDPTRVLKRCGRASL